jgi:hypothetical protein
MDESNRVIHGHIRKPEDYKILNDTVHETCMVIKTELGEVILAIDGNVALMMAMDFVKAVAARMKQDVSKEIMDLTDLGN